MVGRPSRHKKSPRGGQPANVVKRGSTSAYRSSDKRVRQEANRKSDGRRKAALEEVAKERDRLERRMAKEAVEPALGRVSGAEWGRIQREQEEAAQEAATIPQQRRRIVLPAPDAEGSKWTMGQARSMLRAGYHLYHVQQTTGWGAKAFDDMPVDEDGFGLPLE